MCVKMVFCGLLGIYLPPRDSSTHPCALPCFPSLIYEQRMLITYSHMFLHGFVTVRLGSRAYWST